MMNTMNILIAEDEKMFANQLIGYLQQFAAENGIQIHTEICTDGGQLVEHYKPKWDLLILDVNMPIMDGISSARCIREVDPGVPIIFITNFAQYALKSYEVQALDYVLKPVNYYALSMKLKRVIQLSWKETGRFIMLPRDGSLVRMALNRICYVEVFDHALLYHTTEGVIKTTGTRSMGQIEKELEDSSFIRCHSSYLINLRYVQGMEKNMIQVAGQMIPVSRNKKQDVLQAMMTLMKGGK